VLIKSVLQSIIWAFFSSLLHFVMKSKRCWTLVGGATLVVIKKAFIGCLGKNSIHKLGALCLILKANPFISLNTAKLLLLLLFLA
jgi:hypothetical protein